jgi:hypothetical protein
VRLLPFDGIADGPSQQRAVDLTLSQVVLRTGGHRLDPELVVVLAGQHNHRYRRRAVEQPAQAIQASGVGQVEIEHHAPDAVLDGGLGGVQVGRAVQAQARVCFGEQLLGQERVDRVVLDDEYLEFGPLTRN